MELSYKKREIDMTSGNLFKKIIIVAMPLMFSGILQLLYNAADLIVCGKFGTDHAVAAISATNPLISLIVNLFLGFSVGANVLMARSFGSKDKEKCSRVSNTAIAISLILGVCVGAFGFLGSKVFLGWMGTPDEVINLSTKYLKIYFLGLPFSMLYNFGSSLLRAVGDTRRPFIFLSLAGIINVILNLIFVLGFGMDVEGVAIATITAQAISSMLVLICLLKTSGYCKVKFKNIKIHKEELKEMVVIGFPAGLQSALFSISNVIIQSSVNSLGTSIMDGNGASGSLEGFIYTSMNSVASTSLAFVSANYGAKNTKNMKKSVLYSGFIIMIISMSLGLIMGIFGKNLLHLYIGSDDPAIVEVAISAGYKRLTIICFTYFLGGLMELGAFSLRGIGYHLLPTIIALCGACVFRIIWIFTIFQIPEYKNIVCLAISYPISWFLTASIHFVFYFCLRKRVFIKIENEKNRELAFN